MDWREDRQTNNYPVNMRIQLSDHFSYGRLLRFTLPSIATMLFTSVYGIVDGYFVSNFAGKSAFSGLNFAMPLVMILSTLGFMLGTGGSAGRPFSRQVLREDYSGQKKLKLSSVSFS